MRKRADNVSGALPIGEPSPAELCISKLRAMFSRPRRSAGEVLWWLLSTEERRFVCRLARVPVERSAGEFSALSIDQRAAIEAKWRGLRLMVERVQRGMARHG